MGNLFVILLLLSVCLLAVGGVSQFEVKAETSVKRVYLDPEVSHFESSYWALNSIFPVRIMIEDFEEVHGWQVQLNFDSSQLLAFSVLVPFMEYDYIFYGKDVSEIKTEISSTGDYVRIGQNLTVNGDWVTDAAHPKKLAEVYLEMIRLPPKPPTPDVDSVISSGLNINNTDTFLLDLSGVPLQGSEWKFDGRYEYKWAPPVQKPFLMVLPPEETIIQYPPSSVGKQFDASISLIRLDFPFASYGQLGSSELVNVSFALTYDPNLLQVVNISEGPFMRKFGATTFTCTNVPGKAVINEVYLNPPWTTFPFGSGEIARIRFIITYQGAYPAVNQSILNITDVVLKDHFGNAISVDPYWMEIKAHAHYVIEGLLESEIKVINPLTGNGIFRFYTDTTNIGDRFNVTVVVTTGDLFSYQVYLTYNATILKATRAWLPSWDNGTIPWVFLESISLLPSPAFYTGAVLIGDSLLFPEPTFDGTGKLAVLEFEILSSPGENETICSVLSVTENGRFETLLFDNEKLGGRVIPANMTNGLYEYIWSEGILGDLNHDGKIDIKDLAQVAFAFGSYPSHPRWNPEADLNQDSRIDIRDIALIAKNFGKTA